MRIMLVLMIGVALVACGASGKVTASKTTDTRSSTFATHAEKTAFLERYLTLHSPVEATEFHVIFHDNSGGFIAGPSDWDIQAVMRVAPDDIASWTDGMQRVEASVVDLAWANALLQQSGWLSSSPPLVYERSGSLVAVFEADGIIAKRSWTS